jgi:DNA-directed RNA polymerase omega subunit
MPTQSGGRAEEEGQIERLSQRLGKYRLVVAVAKRARDLKERQNRLLEQQQTPSLIDRAIREISVGKVKLVEGEPESE